MENQIELALGIAISAHKGQVDLDGNPAILHPISVGMKGCTNEEMCVGFLHDVVEDTDWTFEGLIANGVSERIVESLRLLFHDKRDEYLNYIEKIVSSGDLTAIRVKMNDLEHNLKRGKAGGHEKQVIKHTAGLAYMKKRLNENVGG